MAWRAPVRCFSEEHLLQDVPVDPPSSGEGAGAAPDPGGPSGDRQPGRESDREPRTPDAGEPQRADTGRAAETSVVDVPERGAAPTAVWTGGAPAAPEGSTSAPPGARWSAPPDPYPGGRPPAAPPTAPYAYPTEQYSSPPGQYGGPPGQYSGPPGQYGGPPGQYGGPPGQYGGGPAPYGGPGQFGVPSGQYGPAQQYGVPPWQHGAPPPGQYGTLSLGQYGASPPGPGGVPPAPRRRRRGLVIALVAVAVLVLAAGGLAAFLLYERSTRTVALLAADQPADDPFTPTLVQSGSLVPAVRFDPTPNRTPAGGLDGLYVDSAGSSGCNRTQLGSVLGGDPALAARWAAPLGAGASPVSRYVDGLTPVRLRADTRLTAHRNIGDQAQPYAAVLQAGTAVLVDDRGLPRVRCADGAPLIGAQPLADPLYGSAWNGFDPAKMIEIRSAGAKIVEFGLVDTAGEEPFRRPAGTAGEEDVAALPQTGRLEGLYLFTGDQTKCEGLQNCPNQTLTSAPRFEGCPQACTVTDREFGEGVALTRDGTVWRAGGTVPTDYRAAVCDGREVPYTFTTTFTVNDSQVLNGVWTATRVTADHEIQAPESATCTAALVTWTINGVGGG